MMRREGGEAPTMNGAMARKAAAMAGGAVLACHAWAQAQGDVSGIVTAVIDGDTVKVQLATGPAIVRLGNIDAPELNQPGGGAAVRALHDKVFTRDVSLDVVSRHGEDRLVAVLFVGDENVNAWMVKQGHAWAYRGQTRDADYCVWENAARSLRRGLWDNKGRDWVAPWDWRAARTDALHFATDYSGANAASCIREISQTASLDE